MKFIFTIMNILFHQLIMQRESESNNAIHHGIEREARHALDAQLSSNVLAVREHRVDADVQFLCNLLVDLARGNESQHVNLARRERSASAAGLHALLKNHIQSINELTLALGMGVKQPDAVVDGVVTAMGEQYRLGLAWQEKR